MRNLTRIIVGAILVMAVALPVAALHGTPVEGRWLSPGDVADGSLQMMTLREFGDDGFFDVVYVDTRATGACEPAARFVGTGSTTLWSDIDGRLFVHLTETTCSGRSTPTIEEIVIEFDPGGGFPIGWDGTLIDEFGNTWYHVSG